MTKNEKLTAAYRLMGLREGASMRELKKVFHEKAMKYHPDLNPSPAAAEEFKAITNAYDLIKDHFRKTKKTAATQGRKPAAAAPAKAPREPFARVGDMAGILPAAELMFRVSNSQNKYVRMHAIRALAGQGGRDAAWCLIRALSDGEPDVCREAVDALGNMRAKFAVMPLINLHRAAPQDLADAVLEALRTINSPMARKYLDGLTPHGGIDASAQQPHPFDSAGIA